VASTDDAAKSIPQVASELCTAHLFNILPLRSEKNILVSAWYKAGLTVVDFTDPTKAKQIGYYQPSDPVGDDVKDPATNMWSAYFYNGHIYANNFAARGVDVFNFNDPVMADEIKLDHLNPQVQEPLPAPGTTPGAGQSITLPAATKGATPGCTKRSGFKLRVRGRRGYRLRSAVIFVGGRRAKVVRGKALRRSVRLTGLRQGRVRVDVTVNLRKGKRVRRISRSRTYRFC